MWGPCTFTLGLLAIVTNPDRAQGNRKEVPPKKKKKTHLRRDSRKHASPSDAGSITHEVMTVSRDVKLGNSNFRKQAPGVS